MNKILLITVSAVFIVLSACSSTDKKQVETELQSDTTTVTILADTNQYIVRIGEYAPDFKMMLPTGDTVMLSSLKGKVVMLQFTASWCGVCRNEMPHIEKEIWQKHKDNPNFALYGIDREEPVETVLEFAKKTGVSYPIGLDPQADIFSLYAERDAGITRNVIIDKDGKIVMLTRLFKIDEFNKMVETIDKLLTKE